MGFDFAPDSVIMNARGHSTEASIRHWQCCDTGSIPVGSTIAISRTCVSFFLYNKLKKTYRIINRKESNYDFGSFWEATVRIFSGLFLAGLLLFLAVPLILGSRIVFVIMLLYIPVITKRIRNEEEVLEEDLAGYKEYKTRVRYKMIPFLW